MLARVTVHRLLWSGGFDSTFRLLSLVEDGRIVEPVYVRQADEWQKQIRERDAMNRILAAIPSDWRRRVHAEPIGESSPDLWADFWKTRQAYQDAGLVCSDQDPMIVSAARVFRGIEAGYVADDTLAADPARRDVFRAAGVTLPLIGLTKRDLLAEARRRGWDELLGITWSCEGTNEDAAAGPCGVCLPCRLRIQV